MRRLLNVTDALSQLVNVAILPRPHDTNANESISGRSHREGWRTAERIIDTVFFFDPGHCRLAHERDLDRARKLIKGT